MASTPQVRLANEIAVQFHHRPHDEAVEEVARHIRQFWDPRMRRQLADAIAAGVDDLDPLARDAAALLPRIEPASTRPAPGGE